MEEKNYYVVYRAWNGRFVRPIAFSRSRRIAAEYANNLAFDTVVKDRKESSVILNIACTREEDFINLDK